MFGFPDYFNDDNIESGNSGRAFKIGSHWPHGQVPYEIVDYGDVEKEIIRMVNIFLS